MKKSNETKQTDEIHKQLMMGIIMEPNIHSAVLDCMFWRWNILRFFV